MDSIKIVYDQLVIDDKKIDLGIFLAMINPDSRILYQFIEKDGVIQAVPYTEEQVIWIDRRD